MHDMKTCQAWMCKWLVSNGSCRKYYFATTFGLFRAFWNQNREVLAHLLCMSGPKDENGVFAWLVHSLLGLTWNRVRIAHAMMVHNHGRSCVRWCLRRLCYPLKEANISNQCRFSNARQMLAVQLPHYGWYRESLSDPLKVFVRRGAHNQRANCSNVFTWEFATFYRACGIWLTSLFNYAGKEQAEIVDVFSLSWPNAPLHSRTSISSSKLLESMLFPLWDDFLAHKITASLGEAWGLQLATCDID